MKLIQKESIIHGTPDVNFAVYSHLLSNWDPSRHLEYIPPHWHPEYEFNYAVKGPLCMMINGIPHTVQPGELLFIDKNMIHSSDRIPKCPGEYFSIVFGEQFVFSSVADSLYQRYLLPLQQQHKRFPTVITGETGYGAKIIDHIKALLQCYSSGRYACQLNIRSHLLEIFGIAIGEEIFVESDIRENSAVFLVRSALTIIHENYMHPITIQRLALRLGVTPSYFCRIFKATIGKRPLEYILSYRIDNARTYLSQSQDSITSIASKCGFDDINYFSRCFKKIQGITPTEYRKNINQGICLQK